MIELITPPVQRPQTPEDWAANGQSAEADWLRLLQSEPTFNDLCAFHAHWFMAAGHKRLGRLYVQHTKKG